MGLEGLASAIFPVLFIGLAALMVRSAPALARAGIGAALTLVLLRCDRGWRVWPQSSEGSWPQFREGAVSELALIVTVAALTYLSRAAAVVMLPRPRGYVLGLVSRIPAPLFASLAVFAFGSGEVVLPDSSTVAAAVAALLASPKRSLGLTLAAGIGGFLLVELVF